MIFLDRSANWTNDEHRKKIIQIGARAPKGAQISFITLKPIKKPRSIMEILKLLFQHDAIVKVNPTHHLTCEKESNHYHMAL